MREDGRDLERAHDATAGNLGWLFVSDVISFEVDRSPRGRNELGQHVEDCGLAGAVGANQSVDHAFANLQRDVAYCHKSFELLREISGFENAVIHGGSSAALLSNHVGRGQVLITGERTIVAPTAGDHTHSPSR